jgi:hypothetical protein
MVKRLVLVVGFVLGVFVAFALGQSTQKPLSAGPVFSGEDFGFQADEPLGAVMQRGRSSVTGRFVVKVDGRWVEARLRVGVMPVK